MNASENEILIEAEHVSKKFCRSLKRSLWYGVKDIATALNPWSTAEDHSLPTDQNLREDEFWAVKDVSFQVRRGECLGLIGHNGAGKSTLLKMLNGLNHPDRGKITMRGRIGALIELGAGFNPVLTGRENIYNQAALLGFSKQETDAKFDAIVDFSELEQFLDMPVQNYSSGMKVKLGFAVSSQMEPDILLIDEVLAVGDLGFRFKCLNRIADLMQQCAVIFVTHSMPQVFRICNEIMLLEAGSIEYQGVDIARGVSKYCEKFAQNEESITGTGEATIVAIMASCGNSDASKGETLSVNYGEDIRIRTKIKLDPAWKNASVQLLFWNTEMLPVMDVLNDQQQAFDFKVDDDGISIVEAFIPNLKLNAGKYNVSAIVTTLDHKMLCRHDGVIAVNVKASSDSGAHVLVSGNWSIGT